jgi:hypothetical protein
VCPKCNRTKRNGQGCPNCGWRPPSKPRKPIVRKTRPKPISDKRRAALTLYAAARVRVLAKDGGCVACKMHEDFDRSVEQAAIQGGNTSREHPVIPCDGIGQLEIDHIDGRVGALFLDDRNMVSLHPYAHHWKTGHARAARPVLREYARKREDRWAAR